MTAFERVLIDYDKSLNAPFIAGCDEAGRGALAGPIVGAGVVFKMDELDETLLSGLRDSKKLSLAHRERLYPLIKEAAYDYEITIIDNNLIDKNGIQWANITALKDSLLNLKCPPKQTIYLADGFNLGNGIKHRRLIKGDNTSAAIAAASVLAKVTRDRIMNEFAVKYPNYGFEKHSGYGTRVHQDAIRLYGPCLIHRTSFKLI